MRLRVVRPFRRAGEHVEPGTLLDIADEREAGLLLTYGDVIRVDAGEAQTAPAAMVVDADPIVQHRDPVRRRGRGQ